MTLPIVKVAAVHAAPVYMNATATVSKAISFIEEAARHGAELVVFPESFIPGFPVWAALWAPIYNHDWFRLMVSNSILIDGPEMAQIQATARRNGVFVSMGFSESTEASVGCIWNSNALIGDDGTILNHHRKLVPTFYEKMVWAPGDGHGLRVNNTRIGRIGALICGENTNPLARYALAAQGEQIHISAWPAIWPTRMPGSGQNFDNLAANRIRAGGHSFEAKAFGILNSGFIDKIMFETLAASGDHQAIEVLENTPRAATQFLDPTGAVIGDTLQTEEGIAYATFDINACVEPKQFHDIVGYYNRFDVFNVEIDRRRLTPARFTPETTVARQGQPSGERVNVAETPFADMV
ncbi:aliphatic nitrilase (plasmid) [Cupriavidus necator N-1]|uniref:Aliphatic nitrilase n=1 Tax=Cupriavidus necator (strain ATCC 43291 / DSM 13513 / CCUG 52238 / LMG 8453 / N-1) TaxID=1042878 RepID=F8GXH7_CUPNN|nr:carbon-nitrogen hydrolase family protein [Cupriavidus necator]AEI82047.1 aliphatic nitrilase [Cupriavidus necator N-1]MDX6008362.1 carbon-nitrogen hydrolase family protein [Cupriavidus necator]